MTRTHCRRYARATGGRSPAEPNLPRAFGDAVWWLSLIALVFNDWWLKGAGLAPTWLTGKLSDFAGLLVAPPLLCSVLASARARGAAALSVAATGLGFAAINTSAAAAAVYRALLAPLGIESRVWVDPGDLVALVVLPIAYLLCLPHERTTSSTPAVLQRAGIVVAALACLGTSGIGGKKSSGSRSDAPQVRNDSGETLLLVISSTEGAGGCTLYRDDRVDIITPDAFRERREVALEPGEQARLLVDSATTKCGAAWLQLADGQEAFVFWRDLEKLASFVEPDDERRRDRTMVIAGSPGRLRFELGDDLERFTPGEGSPEPTCDEDDIEFDLGWSPPPLAQGFVELDAVQVADDGCLEIAWAPAEGEAASDAAVGEPQRLCVPEWAFPFEPGDLLSLVQAPLADGGARLRITRYRGDSPERQLEIWRDARDFSGSRVKRVDPVDCFGRLTDCGAYVRPLEFEIRGEEDTIGAGDQVTVTTGDADRTRVLIGPARDVAWTAPDCEGLEARDGSSASLLELRSF